MKVAVVMGSKSDLPIMQDAIDVLKNFGITTVVDIVSAHRTPEKLMNFSTNAHKNDIQVIIAGAGLAAHLPGVIASKTILPVVGVPLNGALEGLDALYSIVQMPKSIPVATVGINNSYNSGMLAVQILAIKYPEIREKLINFRKEMKAKFIADNEKKVEL